MTDATPRARALLAPGRRIVAFTGAGLSAESGVPTFRDAATDALWARHDPARLASPEGFAADPATVLAWYAWRRRRVAEATPNAAHHALARRRDVVNVTQNVDDLLERAGVSGAIHLHGTLGADRCDGDCGHRETVELAEADAAPRRCPGCGSALRPDVVWFGEPLPAAAWRAAAERCAGCAVLLVVGTSGVVHPAASLVDRARAAGATIVVVDPNPTAAAQRGDLVIPAPAGAVLPELLDVEA